jgi:hypothetical protein
MLKIAIFNYILKYYQYCEIKYTYSIDRFLTQILVYFSWFHISLCIFCNMYMYAFVFKQIKSFVNAEYILYSETMYIYSVHHAVIVWVFITFIGKLYGFSLLLLVNCMGFHYSYCFIFRDDVYIFCSSCSIKFTNKSNENPYNLPIRVMKTHTIYQ